MAKPLDESGHGRADGEGQPGHDAAGEGGLGTGDLEVRSHRGKQKSIGVAEADLDEGDGEGGEDDQPRKATSLGFCSFTSFPHDDKALATGSQLTLDGTQWAGSLA